jgi:hypothetical protein
MDRSRCTITGPEAMDRFDLWDGVFLAIAGYVAVITLVRMMAAHRKKVAAELHEQIQVEHDRKIEEERRKKKEEKAEKAKKAKKAEKAA